MYEEALAFARDISDRILIALNIEAFAALATAQNQMERATRLLGAAERLDTPFFEMSTSNLLQRRDDQGHGIAFAHHAMGASHLLQHLDKRDHAIASAHAALGEKAFEAAWEEGQKMTMEQAIAYALKEESI